MSKGSDEDGMTIVGNFGCFTDLQRSVMQKDVLIDFLLTSAYFVLRNGSFKTIQIKESPWGLTEFSVWYLEYPGVKRSK